MAVAGAIASPASLAAAPAPANTTTLVRYLSGTGPADAVPWEFYCTAGRHHGVWTKIPVPSCWEQQGFGTYYYGVWRRGHPESDPAIPKEQGIYRTAFEIPAAWRGRRVRLVFDGVMTDAAVRVNGRSAGPVHQGSFYRFHFDITPLVKFGGENRLEVTVSKESANPSVNAAERRGDYWTFGGIFRPVWLAALPRPAIDWTGVDARADGTFRAQVHLVKRAGPGLSLAGQIERLDGTPVGRPFSVAVPAGAKEVMLQTKVDGVRLWTAETPSLYRVRLTLSKDGSVRHTIAVRFGFRTFAVRPGDGLYLNGRKIVLKGVDRHCFRPESGRTLSPAESMADARLIKSMNMNAVRCSHYPPDASFLKACDELGIYVLDELAGWHGHYDTPTGRKLIGEMVRRDVNHPSVLFWDNGNEGGWNTANDGEFAKWDLQHRAVLHPWALFSGVNTKHYPDYALLKKLAAGPDVFMPTEMLHGLYDGGIGSGFHDYWQVMSHSPFCAGGFFWVFADEGVVRTDEDGRIDVSGDYAPDGILGPHHEKEGSYYTVKQIWSPVQVTAPATLGADWDGALAVSNHYDFTNLDRGAFAWRLVRLPAAAAGGTGVVLASGTVPGPDVAPQASGRLVLPLPAGWRGDAAHGPDVLYVTTENAAGDRLWTWSWPVRPVPEPAMSTVATGEGGAPTIDEDEGGELEVRVGTDLYRFDRTDGRLLEVRLGGHILPLHDGPRFLAYRRHERDFVDVSGPSRLTGLTARADGADVIVEATYDGALRNVRWRLAPGGFARLDYAYAFAGPVDLLGVEFDFPEQDMQGVRWLGWGPYRVWQNRLEGTRLGVWSNAYNDTTPGESWVYPEFKGYFRDWQWAEFKTTAGRMSFEHRTGGRFLGVYRPNSGWGFQVLRLPATGLAFLDVIPAMGTKFKLPDQLGPEGQTRNVAGVHRGSIVLHLEAP